MEENRIIETTDLPGDSWQYSLRPHYLREYIGQDKVKDNLEVFIKFNHTIFYIIYVSTYTIHLKCWFYGNNTFKSCFRCHCKRKAFYAQ